jgi:hypothetical protein
VVGRDRAGERRPQVGQVAVVEQRGARDPGPRVEQDHQPAEARQPRDGLSKNPVETFTAIPP